MEKGIFEKIISLLNSRWMIDHLLANQATLKVSDYLDIVLGAPVSLKRKHDMLEELAAAVKDGEERSRIIAHITVLTEAVDELMHISPERSMLTVANISYDDENRPFPIYRCDSVFPAASYYGAQLGIQKFNRFELDGEAEDTPLWYWELRLYRILEDGSTELAYTYICSWNGEMQYLRLEARDLSKWNGVLMEHFGRAIPDLNLPVPYQPGDILYVDCRPYTPPAYCLIIETGDDCCGVQCLYYWGGYFCTGAFKHGHYFEGAYDIKQYISPLYRAQKYIGALPEGHEIMERIAENLKRDPACGTKIWTRLTVTWWDETPDSDRRRGSESDNLLVRLVNGKLSGDDVPFSHQEVFCPAYEDSYRDRVNSWDDYMGNLPDSRDVPKVPRFIRYQERFEWIFYLGPWRRYIFAADSSLYYIIDTETEDDKVLWSHAREDKDFFPCGEPCIIYCGLGMSNDLPVFFDCANGNEICPGEE